MYCKSYNFNINTSIDSKISYICLNEYNYFLNKPNVTGIGLGYKIINGFSTFEKCIGVFVTKKIAENNLDMKNRIPKTYKGIKTDVIQSNKIKVSSLTNKVRPTFGGYNIGSSINYKTGTLGCLVTDEEFNYILTNYHVITNEGNPPIGTPILQPGISYSGKIPKDIIATLAKYIPIKFATSPQYRPSNLVDCAIGKLSNPFLASPQVALLGLPKGIASPTLGQNVQKTGCESEKTTGKITHISASVLADVSGKEALFRNQIVTTLMSQAGDSGAVLFDESMNALGFLIGATDCYTVYNSIKDVLNNLNVRLITN
ncbi:S1 family peptidase [Clostridium botulinum]|uniref:Peptidase S1 domain-containing protein n=1 Tax=Clostridium botulinum D str. 1873 TaxID=592027 RepID=A0A9P2LKN4_CLOBO|nr:MULTISPECIES: trypsin-like serine protease [Clostridium]EES90699.1 conserved hypothetical protein [Clostridium botulinum D str. 1873]MBO3441324.1 trypsin-like serine protease [Clostridium haemolyticum]NFV47263.1 S1 family peptidase [Clostridium botulinum]QPW54911.1 trypsin-like serine protease [Clostridium botulinum]